MFLTLGAAGAALATLESKASTQGVGKDASVRITYMPVRQPPHSLPGPGLVSCEAIHIAGRNATHKGRQGPASAVSVTVVNACRACCSRSRPQWRPPAARGTALWRAPRRRCCGASRRRRRWPTARCALKLHDPNKWMGMGLPGL